MNARRLALLLSAALVAMAVVPLPASAAEETRTVLHDTFDTLDEAAWSPLFYLWSGSISNPSSGVATITGGALTLRPTPYRGISLVESKQPVVTRLPARVTYRARFPRSGFREINIRMAAVSAGDHILLPAPLILMKLGNTSYNYQTNPYIQVCPVGGGLIEVEHDEGTVVPSDMWLEGTLELYDDRVTSTFNGVTMTAYADVASMVAAQGGLRFLLNTMEDMPQGGFDLDEVRVEELPHRWSFIRGRVTDSSSGAPLPGIAVRAFHEGDEVAARLATSTVTAADGSYELTLTVEGWHGVSFDDPNGTYRDEIFPDSGLPLEWSGALHMSPEEVVEGVDASLTRLDWLRAHRAVRVSGADRYQTAMAVSRANYRRADTVVIASGAGFADATAASPLCGAYRAPLLLTSRYRLPSGLFSELKRLGAKRLIVVGSSVAVSDEVVVALRNAGYPTTRIHGRDRYETAAAIVQHLLGLQDVDLADYPFVVRGDAFPDALAVAPFAYAQRRPVLLVRPDAAPVPTVATLARLGTDHIIVVGSERAVGTTALQGLAAGTASRTVYYHRIEGGDRYQTSTAVVDFWQWPYDRLGVATGSDFPDALTGGIALGEYWGGLLLTRPTQLAPDQAGLIARNGRFLWPVQVYGGPSIVSDGVMSSISLSAGTDFLDHGQPLGTLRATAAARGTQAGTRGQELPAGVEFEAIRH